jgi:hypothetical protein
VSRAATLVPWLTLLGCVEAGGPEPHTLDGPCHAVVTDVPIEDSPHLEVGTPIEWTSNPPASGPHFPVWARWEHRYSELSRAFWLHNAEHGGIVLLHRCTDCPDVIADLTATIASLPDDPHCVAPIRTRTLIAHDPLLPPAVAIAAVAWGTHYTASCVDDTVATFARDHIGRAGENTCADGLGAGTGVPIE